MTIAYSSQSQIRLLVATLAASLLWVVPAMATPTVYNVDLDPMHMLFGSLNQNDVDACKDAAGISYTCGPTAAVNSFAYLQRRYPLVYGERLIPDTNNNDMIDYDEMKAVAELLGTDDYMKCAVCNGGTLINDFILGKTKYINEKAPGTTRFQDQNFFGTPSVTPDWKFLFGELLDGEDVEILIGFYMDDGMGGLKRTGGHYLTIKDFMWTDADMDMIIDPVEGAMISYIDPATGAPGMSPLFNVGDFMKIGYGANSFIETVVSESPLPEPGTLILVSIGAIGLGVMRRRASRGATI